VKKNRKPMGKKSSKGYREGCKGWKVADEKCVRCREKTAPHIKCKVLKGKCAPNRKG